MIRAKGVVYILANCAEPLEKFTFKNKKVSLKVIGTTPLASEDGNGTAIKIACTYIATLPRSFECRSLEDYTGRIQPFLEKSIKRVVIGVEINYLNYMSG